MRKILKKLTISAPCEDYEVITALLAREMNFGWEEAEGRDGECIWRVHNENAPFLEAAAARMAKAAPEAAFTLEDVEDRDWLEAWREFFTPVKAGPFTVLPPWLDDGGEKSVVIEPKSAFGTGHHASTVLCLAAIGELAGAGRLAPGGEFLDLGCGSGVLAIACAKCGLRGVACDIDPLAADNARENIMLNHVCGVEVIAGSLEAVAGRCFSLVLANILARPLIEMAGEICAATAPGGSIVLSGILASQAPEVAAAYVACGLKKPRELEREEWRALVFVKA